MGRSSFYQTHLDRVSRSFAFCIAELQEPFREWVGLSYILCRLADTIEDAPWDSLQSQMRAFQEFEQGLHGAQNLEFISPESPIRNKISPGERELLNQAPAFFFDLQHLPEEARTAIVGAATTMAQGMSKFRQKSPTALRLNNADETNEYCFYVAGVIGELLTRLLELTTPGFKASNALLENSLRFGLYLQKINLLKDQLTDEPQGRFLVYSRTELLHSLLEDSRRALAYLQAIPLERADFRLFCAWSLFLGLISLPWIEKSWSQKKTMKISRTETYLLLGKIRNIVNSNEALEQLYAEVSKGAG